MTLQNTFQDSAAVLEPIAQMTVKQAAYQQAAQTQSNVDAQPTQAQYTAGQYGAQPAQYGAGQPGAQPAQYGSSQPGAQPTQYGAQPNPYSTQPVPAQGQYAYGFAITSFVLGIASIVSGWTFIAPIIGVILGVIALRRNTSEPALAKWGIWLNGIMLALFAVAAVVIFGLLGMGLAAGGFGFWL